MTKTKVATLYERDPCNACTRRRCKLQPVEDRMGNLSCTKIAPAKSGWTMKELLEDK